MFRGLFIRKICLILCVITKVQDQKERFWHILLLEKIRMFVSKLIEADEDKIKASIEVNRRIITREIATRLN